MFRSSPPAAGSRWWHGGWWRDAAGVWLVTRILFVLLTYFVVTLVQGGNTFAAPHPSMLHRLLPAWQRWDTEWYIDIARRGYAWHKAVGTYPTAFFPLYPVVLRIVATLSRHSYLASALLVSNVSFLLALLYLWKLARWEFEQRVAHRTTLYIAVFPTALFFFAGYSESLFLLLTVASFYHLRRRDWWLAGLLGGLAAATRVTGVILVAPFLYEYARDRNFSLRAINPGALGLPLIVSGLAAFMVYLQVTVGDALAFSHHQAAWQKILTLWLPGALLESARQILVVQPQASFFQAQNVLDLGAAVGFLAILGFSARRLPLAYTLYQVAFWLLALSSPALAGGYPVPLVSLSRYVLSLFPAFLYLGLLGQRQRFHEVYLVLSTALLAVLTVQFLTGWFV